ncbi:hypothetical protein D3C71_2172070 [compost metagenome]
MRGKIQVEGQIMTADLRQSGEYLRIVGTGQCGTAEDQAFGVVQFPRGRPGVQVIAEQAFDQG